MTKLNLDNLLKSLQKVFPDAAIQKETKQVFAVFKNEEVEFPVFGRIAEDENLIQLLVFFPCNLKKGAEAETARSLHLLNKEIDVPGFGMDEGNSLLYFRYMLPSVEGHYEEVLVEKFTNAFQMICKTFFPLVFAVSQGLVTFPEVEKKVKETVKASSGES